MVKPLAKVTSGIKYKKTVPHRLSKKALAALVLRRPAKGASTKTLDANLAGLRPHLGRKCPHFGKRGVVQLGAPPSSSAPRKAKGSIEADAPPKFNKYAGWVEWKNAIFLWVNAFGGNFVNSFSGNGRQVTWYVGGAKPTESSPIVGRLLRASRGQAPEAKTKVLLFVRELATEPYLYCGGVSYVSHNPSKKGFEFTFRLQDHTGLQKIEGFRSLLDAAKQDGQASSKSAPVRRAAARWA